MSVSVNCERCRKLIAEVPGAKVKDWLQANDEVCKDCKEAEASLAKFYETKKNKYIGRFEALHTEAKKELVEETKRLAGAI